MNKKHILIRTIMIIFHWNTYLYYNLFLICKKEEWDAKWTAKIFGAIALCFVLSSIITILVNLFAPSLVTFFSNPWTESVLGLLCLVFVNWYYYGRMEEIMKPIGQRFHSMDKKKQITIGIFHVFLNIMVFVLLFLITQFFRHY